MRIKWFYEVLSRPYLWKCIRYFAIHLFFFWSTPTTFIRPQRSTINLKFLVSIVKLIKSEIFQRYFSVCLSNKQRLSNNVLLLNVLHEPILHNNVVQICCSIQCFDVLLQVRYKYVFTCHDSATLITMVKF